jgi:histidinol dehydrogenase
MEEKSINPVGAPLGNKNNTKNKPFLDAMRRALAQNPQKIRSIVDKVLEKAEEGESWAVKEVADRLDGKAVQATTFEDAEGNSLLQAIEVRFVKPSET